MRFVLLVNPVAGGGRALGVALPVARRLREAGARAEVRHCRGPASTRALVDDATAAGAVVVAVGGDGMVSSVAGAVSRGEGVLGVLPAGRGNDFARVLGLPTDPVAQAALLLSGRARRVDLVSMGDRLVVGSVYAGVDARASVLVDRARRLPRRLQYPVAAVGALAGHRPGRYRVDVDGTVAECDAATVVVASAGCYGSGMRIAPGARVDDGELDVVVVGATSRLALLRALPSVYDGSHVGRPEVRVLRGRRVRLAGAAPGERPIPVGGDGEPLGVLPGLDATPAVVEVRPAALRVLAP